MKDHRKPRRNLATFKPLTPASPAFDRSLPERTVQRVADLRVETVLFEQYLEMKRERNRLRERVIELEKLLARWKAKGYAKKLASHMHPRRKEAE